MDFDSLVLVHFKIQSPIVTLHKVRMLPSSYTYIQFNNTYIPIRIYLRIKYLPTYLLTIYLLSYYLPTYLLVTYTLPT
jgi:hypothetical protein